MIKGSHIVDTLKKHLPVLQDRVSPNFTTDISAPSIVYFIRPSVGGYVGQITLELRVIWNDYDETETIAGQIIDVFDVKENDVGIALEDISFRSVLSGGGVLFRDDLQVYEYSLIFTLKTKERR